MTDQLHKNVEELFHTSNDTIQNRDLPLSHVEEQSKGKTKYPYFITFIVDNLG